MNYRIETIRKEEYPGDDSWEKATKIEFGCGQWYYLYINDQLVLGVENCNCFFSEAIVFHDYLLLGDDYQGVHVINLIDFSVKNDIRVDGYFGYFVVDRDTLYVLGQRNIMAFGSDLDLLWKTVNIAVDGVVFKSTEGDTMTVKCLHEPMSEEWEDAKISLPDGRLITGRHYITYHENL